MLLTLMMMLSQGGRKDKDSSQKFGLFIKEV